jgi:hypothetical protein
LTETTAAAKFPDYANDPDYSWSDKRGAYVRTKSHNGAKGLMKRELIDRQTRIDDGEEVEWETQNSFYYYMRTIFLENGIDPDHEGDKFRENMTQHITTICHELETTREDLNIIAKDRATFYHKGQETKISLDSLEDLAKKGTDIILIEKSGICKLFAPYAAKAGIALLDSEGFIVEYARRLSGLSQENGCNIALLKDSRMMTTHKATIELIKEGKIKMVKPKDKPYSQIDYLVINEKNEFNKIYNALFAIEIIIDNLIEFKNMIVSAQDDFPDEASTSDLELNFVKPLVELLNSYLADLATKIKDKSHSDVDREILYKRNAELALKMVKGVQPSKFDKSMEELIRNLQKERKKAHKEKSILKIDNLETSMEKYKRDYLS